MANKNGNTNTNSQPPKMPQPPMRNIDFQVDTISKGARGNTAASFNPNNNIITVNYVKNKDKKNSSSYSDSTLIHEQKHFDNTLQGMYEYPVNPEQAYKLEMYDEISGNIASLLLLRQKYLETGDLSIFDKEDQGLFKFYKNAIKNGKINPKSNTQADFDKEMSFIVNNTKKMWEANFAWAYNEANSTNAANECDITGKYEKYHNQNYIRGRKIALTLGGVDFSKYLDKDVEIPASGKKKLYDKIDENFSGAKKLWLSAKNKVETLLNINNSVKNEKTNPVNKEQVYRKWADKDGFRVSEVQHRELPDMTKDVIRKPGKQVSAAQQSYTAKTKTTTATKQSYTAQADVKSASPQTSQNQSVKARMKQAAASRAAVKPKPQKLNKPLKQQMSEDAKKYQTQKKVRRQQQQKTTAPRYDNTVKNDNIPTNQQIAPAMKIRQLRGVERSTPAKRVVKREVSGSIRTKRQLTND